MKKEKNYDFKKIEKKWQNAWEKKKVFQVKESSKKKKFYCLEMFPYPSGSGLHMGHALNYSIGDVYSRFKRMRGFNVLYPMGFDSFGLPAENAAIKAKEHPKKYAEKSIKNFIKQMKEIGLSYDWSRTLKTSDPDYYKWNQLFFLKFLENGLVYRKKASVNFCRRCNTVLANEQVHNGMCWRHTDTEVEIKQLEQWFIKTTKYADELLKCVDGLNWPNRIKIMQKNWIGKSYGTEIEFEIDSKISKVVLMHGKDTNPDEKWYLWFGNEVKRKGIEYIAPVLPDSHDPEIGAWLKKLDETDPDENTILVGHSRGGVSILRWLEKLPKGKRVKKVVLVAANAGDSKKRNKTENNKGFFSVKGYDFEKIKSHCDNFVVIHSRDDNWVPFSAGEENAKGLNAKFSIYENKGHFGKHVGKECEEILDEVFEKWPIFTTRLDTIFGTTFMVVSAQHPRLKELVTKEQKINVDKFLKKVRSTSEKDVDILEKEGVFTGSYAINPVNNEKVPVYVGNFVLADYGSGMVMAVPAHDQRDFEFAKKYKIPVKQVIRKEKHPVRSY
ncbi:MAG: class I tRNA ligase family protein, partial [Candidatus Nanoarchaeia archaeon]